MKKGISGRWLSSLREVFTPSLLALLLFQVISGMLVAPLLSLFPVYVERNLGMSTVFSANIRILSVCSGGVVALVGGAICDSLGRKPAYLLAMTGVIAAGVMFLTHRPAVMYPLAVYGGLMFGLGAVAGLSYVMGTAPSGSLGIATACYFMAGTVGNAIGSAVSGVVARELPNGYELIGGTMTVGHAVLLAAAALVLPALPRPETPRTLRALVGGYGDIVRGNRTRALLALRFLPTVYWGCATFLMPLLLYRVTGSEKPAGYYASASLVFAAICQMAMGRIVDRFGTRVPVIIAITLVTVATLGQGLFATSFAALVGFGLLGAGAAWALSVTMTTLVQQMSTSDTSSKLLGLTHVAWSLGFLSGTGASGFLARQQGQGSLAFLISAAFCAVGILCGARVVSGLAPHSQAEEPLA